MQTVYNFNLVNRQHKKWLVKGATILAAVLLCIVLAHGLYNVYKVYKARKQQANAVVMVNSAAVKTAYSIDTVMQQHIFGEKKVVVAPKKPEKAPETKLDLTIEGLLSATAENRARAIISVKKKRGTLYKVGDELKGTNVTLEEIRVNGVLLNRNGVIENLAFEKKTVSGNRRVVKYSDPGINNPNIAPVPEDIPNQNNTINRSRSRQNNANDGSDSTRRSVRRPNFKGLDEALDKMQKL